MLYLQHSPYNLINLAKNELRNPQQRPASSLGYDHGYETETYAWPGNPSTNPG